MITAPMARRFALAAALLCALFFAALHAGPAAAKNWHLGWRHGHAPRHSAVQRHLAAHGRRRALAIAVAAPAGLDRVPILAEAARFLGRGNPTPFREAWCRDFVNLVARLVGLHLANQSHRAIDALGLGLHVRRPRPGDLAVIGRHHVTIVAGWRRGRLVGLGGNQGRHRVQFSTFDPRRVVAFVRL